MHLKSCECEALAAPQESMMLSWYRSELLLLILPQMMKKKPPFLHCFFQAIWGCMCYTHLNAQCEAVTLNHVSEIK